MSKHKHNYTQYSNKPKSVTTEVKMESIPEVKSVQETSQVMQSKPKFVQETSQVVRPSLVTETVETKILPAMVEGHVAGCAKLNVRADASLFADVVCTLDVMSEIMIDVNKSTKDWLYICTATGIEGYCMKKFVDARL